jgi:3-oxoadipate enol-lactonase
MGSIHFLDPNPEGSPPVLLLHGLGANANSWLLQFQPLSEAGFRPLAVDAPGFGESPYDGRSWTTRRVAASVVELLDELGAAPAHVVGLSMGGIIAQQLALDFPAKVRSLVLVSTFAHLRPDNLSGWLYFLRRFLVIYALGLKAQARVVVERIFPGEDRAPLRQLLVDSISQADLRAYRAAMGSLGSFNSVDRLGEIKVPTLVVTGRQDTTVLPMRQRILVEGIPGARQVVLESAGHAVPVDQPDEFNRELLGFLKSN